MPNTSVEKIDVSINGWTRDLPPEDYAPAKALIVKATFSCRDTSYIGRFTFDCQASGFRTTTAIFMQYFSVLCAVTTRTIWNPFYSCKKRGLTVGHNFTTLARSFVL